MGATFPIKSWLFLGLNELFKRLQMRRKGLSACKCDGVTGIGLAAHKRFFYLHKAFFFEAFEVTGEVAVGDIEQLLQAVEVELRIGRQGRHQPQTNAAVESFVQLGEGLLHFS